jgi:hypothetical protein
MWDPQRLTTLWAFTACYRDSITFFFYTLILYTYYYYYYYYSTYLQSEPFLSITFTLIKLKLLITFVHTPNVLCYVRVVLSYHVLVTTPHLRLFVYFLY